MGHVRYSPAARADLEKIALDIVGNNGPLLAERNTARIRRSLANVGHNPEMGTKRYRPGRAIWSWPTRPWLAF